MKRQSLSRGALDALRRLDGGVFIRQRGGWHCPGQSSISLDISNRLVAMDLAQSTGHRLTITARGRAILDMRRAG